MTLVHCGDLGHELNEEQQALLEQYSILNYCGMVDLFDQTRPMFCMDEN